VFASRHAIRRLHGARGPQGRAAAHRARPHGMPCGRIGRGAVPHHGSGTGAASGCAGDTGSRQSTWSAQSRRARRRGPIATVRPSRSNLACTFRASKRDRKRQPCLYASCEQARPRRMGRTAHNLLTAGIGMFRDAVVGTRRSGYRAPRCRCAVPHHRAAVAHHGPYPMSPRGFPSFGLDAAASVAPCDHRRATRVAEGQRRRPPRSATHGGPRAGWQSCRCGPTYATPLSAPRTKPPSPDRPVSLSADARRRRGVPQGSGHRQREGCCPRAGSLAG